MNEETALLHLPDLADYAFDGRSALQTIIQASVYKTTAQAVASLTKFSHPATVAQTNNQNVFRTIRRISSSDVGKYIDYKDGSRVMLDDNKSPTCAFVWASGSVCKGCTDVQFNHVWSSSRDVELYTSLANLCVTPAFLSKLTDTDIHVCALLRYRAYELYNGFKPKDEAAPLKPAGYDRLTWAEPLPLVQNLEDRLRQAIRTKPKDRTVKSINELGWYFNGFTPGAA